MKHLFNAMFMFAPEATEQTATATVPAEPVYTSEKLTALMAEGEKLAAEFQGKKYGTTEYNTAKLALLKHDKAIDEEINSIKKAIAEQKLAEQRQARIALADNFKIAVLANTGKQANETTAAAEKDAYDALCNALLPSNKPAVAPKEGAGERGKTTSEIYDLLKTRIDGGMEPGAAVKEVIALGYSRGTVGSVRTEHWPAK